MGKWNIQNLGNLTFVKGGKRLPKGHDYTSGITKHPYLRVVDFKNNSVDVSNLKYLSSETASHIKRYTISCEDVYISIAGTIGLVGTIPYEFDKANLTENAAKLVIKDKNKIYKYYLVSYLSSEYGQKQIQTKTITTTQPKLALFRIEELEIPLPPLETQKQIAKTLDTAAELVAMRKQQLAELDNLIKSIFFEMFGNPVANEKGWIFKPIGDFSMVKIGPFGSLLHTEDYIEGGFPIVNPSHIVQEKIVPDMKLTLSTNKFKELKGYVMKKGDIVVGRRGEIGRCAVVDDEGFLCGTGSMFIRIEKDYLPIVLKFIISSDSIRAKLEHHAVGVTMKNLNAGTISNLEIPMIPISLQYQFTFIVAKIEEQKALVQKAIDETQYLFDSLMSEYFD